MASGWQIRPFFCLLEEARPSASNPLRNEIHRSTRYVKRSQDPVMPVQNLGLSSIQWYHQFQVLHPAVLALDAWMWYFHEKNQ